MATYNGHRSWNAWNVALWIGNDEGLYHFALDCLNGRNISQATKTFMRDLGSTRTPDGATYNYTCVMEALKGLRD